MQIKGTRGMKIAVKCKQRAGVFKDADIENEFIAENFTDCHGIECVIYADNIKSALNGA